MFKIEISLNAQEELDNIEDLYFNISSKTSEKFILNLSNIYSILKVNPFFGVRYKNYRAITIDKFPYLLFFEIDQVENIVYILSYFHMSRNPAKYPF